MPGLFMRGWSLIVVAMMLALTPVGSSEPPPGCTPESDATEADVDVGDQETLRVYIDHETSDIEWQGQWVFAYVESNGMDGLQRKDWWTDNTVCTMGPPDTWIWYTTVLASAPA